MIVCVWKNLLFKCFLMMFLNCGQISCFGLETLDLVCIRLLVIWIWICFYA